MRRSSFLAIFALLALLATASVAQAAPPSSPFSGTWLGQDTLPLCYVSDTSVSATFQYDPLCGSAELQHFLNTGEVALSIQSILPNPVEHSATIGFTANTTGLVNVVIYDVMGSEVRRLVDHAAMKPGVYAVQLPGEGLTSGVYFCRITDGRSTATKRFEKMN